MKKFIFLTAALVTLTAPAFALGTGNATAWAGKGCQSVQGSTTGFNYCMANITSGTTTTQLGRVTIYPSKQIYIVGGVSGTAVSGLVTPTVSYYLGNRVVATQTISVTTAGNVVNPGSVPYFDSLSISVTTPSTISATNAAVIAIIENDK